MSVEPADIRSPYSGFLVDKLNKIYDSWDKGDYVLALSRTCRLVYFLQTDMKEVLWPKMAVITEKLNRASGVSGVDFFTQNLNRNRQARVIALRELPRFLNELVMLLDAKNFLGITKRKVPEGHE